MIWKNSVRHPGAVNAVVGIVHAIVCDGNRYGIAVKGLQPGQTQTSVMGNACFQQFRRLGGDGIIRKGFAVGRNMVL